MYAPNPIAKIATKPTSNCARRKRPLVIPPPVAPLSGEIAVDLVLAPRRSIMPARRVLEVERLAGGIEHQHGRRALDPVEPEAPGEIEVAIFLPDVDPDDFIARGEHR